MKHFIGLRIVEYSDVKYYYNNKPNKIGDFSSYSSTSYGYWVKDRLYRGRFVYSKKSHFENCNRIKQWHYDGKWYDSYEEYMMAVMW